MNEFDYRGWVHGIITDVESYTINASDWTAIAVEGASPFTHYTTVTSTHTIGEDTQIEILNDQIVLFGNHGFGVKEAAGQVITIYSIGAPTSEVTLKIAYTN